MRMRYGTKRSKHLQSVKRTEISNSLRRSYYIYGSVIVAADCSSDSGRGLLTARLDVLSFFSGVVAESNRSLSSEIY